MGYSKIVLIELFMNHSTIKSKFLAKVQGLVVLVPRWEVKRENIKNQFG